MIDLLTDARVGEYRATLSESRRKHLMSYDPSFGKYIARIPSQQERILEVDSMDIDSI
jgi:hypothetical protein